MTDVERQHEYEICVPRHRFPRETRRGSMVRMFDPSAPWPPFKPGTAVTYRTPRVYEVTQRSASFLWLREVGS